MVVLSDCVISGAAKSEFLKVSLSGNSICTFNNKPCALAADSVSVAAMRAQLMVE